MPINAIPLASSVSAGLFANASAQGHGLLGNVAIDDCGTVVPHKIPGTNPPPPPPFQSVQLAGVSSVAFSEDGPRCGNEPRKWPFPPPPPLPMVSDLTQTLGLG